MCSLAALNISSHKPGGNAERYGYSSTSSDLLAAKQGAVYLRQGEPAIYRLTGFIGTRPALEIRGRCGGR